MTPAEAFDKPIIAALTAILECDTQSLHGNWAVEQATLPIALGGMGITLATNNGEAAFVGSMAASWHHIASFVPRLNHPPSAPELRSAQCVQAFCDMYAKAARAQRLVRRCYDAMELESLGHNGRQPFHPPSLPAALPPISEFMVNGHPKIQRCLTAITDHSRWRVLFETLRARGLDRDAVRLISVSQRHATAFHHAIPSHPRFIIQSPHLLTISQYQLGLDLSCLRGISEANGRPIDSKGDSLINACMENGDGVIRHNAVMRAWLTGIRMAWRGEATVKGDRHDHESYSPGARPDGTIVNALPRRRHFLLECKVVSPLSSAGEPKDMLALRVACAGTAPKYQELIDAKYAPARRQGHVVVPLIHETFGGIAPVSLRFMAKTVAKAKGRRIAEFDDVNAPWSAPTLKPYLAQTISIALQTSIAEQVLKMAADIRVRAVSV